MTTSKKVRARRLNSENAALPEDTLRAIGRIALKLAQADSPPLPSEGFIRLPEVLRVFPVSEAQWWGGIKAGIYPRAYALGTRIRAWRVADIRRLIESAPEANSGNSPCRSIAKGERAAASL